MPSVQWFPGHMHAAKKKIAAALKNIDLVLELLDARCPLASQNPMIVELLKTRQKPSLKLLNKSDLADSVQNQQWQAFFEKQANTHALIINALNQKDIRRVLKTAQELAPHRGSALKPLRIMVLGIPNVGKSTFLNAVAQKKITQTGDVPALTKAIQRIDISKNLILFDTPGLMWPKIENLNDGLRLSAINAIGVNAFDVFETALFLANFLQRHYPKLLTKRYNFSSDFLAALDSSDWVDSGDLGDWGDSVALKILAEIAKRRGAKLKGGVIDLEKSAHILLSDFRSNALGKISLEWAN